MPAVTGEILNPTSLVIPDYGGLDVSTAEAGMIFMSGAKLHFISTVGTFEVVTST